MATSTYPPAHDTLALTQVWNTLKPDSCPYNYNFHLHTLYSDGQLRPEALLEQAVEIGLKGLAITDHHSVRGSEAAQTCLETLRTQRPYLTLPCLWTGVEITANLLGAEVHILGYAFDPSHWAMQVYLQGDRPWGQDANVASVVAAVHQAGGLAVLAHPSRYSLPANQLIPAAAQLGIDGTEAYYAYGNPKPWRASPSQTAVAEQLAQECSLYKTCGTDTHGLSILQRI